MDNTGYHGEDPSMMEDNTTMDEIRSVEAVEA